jgi:phosphoribosylamine--glycine ligase
MPDSFSDDSELFLAGVQADPKNRGLLNSGGRVLGVTALADSIEKARELAYENLEKIQFKGMYFRKDIAANKRGRKGNG